MKRVYHIKGDRWVDETVDTRPMYRKIDERTYEFIGFENGIRAEQLVESTRKWYQDRAKKAELQGSLFAAN